MRVAVLGGTGKMGGAIARKLSQKNQVIVGSRDKSKAVEAAKLIPGAIGADYAEASKAADVAVVTLPSSALQALATLREQLAGKLVVSAVNPLRSEDGLLYYGREAGSAAEEIGRLLPQSKVATGFNNIPVGFLKMEEVPRIDVLVAASTKEAFEEAAKLIASIPNLQPLYAGPLSQARLVEMITPLVLNLARLNETGALTTVFVSREG